LLLEDMAGARPGDQIAGCTPEHARAAVVNLAGLHGPTWCDETLRSADWLWGDPEATSQILEPFLQVAADGFEARFLSELDDDERAVLAASRELLVPWVAAAGERFAVVHGDYRLDNLLFPTDDPSGVAAVDWQTVGLGPPGRDLAYFLATSLRTEDRRRHEADLLETYHQALGEQGSRATASRTAGPTTAWACSTVPDHPAGAPDGHGHRPGRRDVQGDVAALLTPSSTWARSTPSAPPSAGPERPVPRVLRSPTGYTGAVAPRPDVPETLPATTAGADPDHGGGESPAWSAPRSRAAGRAGTASAAGVGDAAERAARALARRVVAGAATRRHALSDRASLARALSEKPHTPAIASAAAAAVGLRFLTRYKGLGVLAKRTPMWLLATAVPTLVASVTRGADELGMVAAHLIHRARAEGIEPDLERVRRAAVQIVSHRTVDPTASPATAPWPCNGCAAPRGPPCRSRRASPPPTPRASRRPRPSSTPARSRSSRPPKAAPGTGRPPGSARRRPPARGGGRHPSSTSSRPRGSRADTVAERAWM
jgi:hypothetical protein